MITVSRIASSISALGGAQFLDSSGRRVSVLAAGESANEQPIEIHFGANGMRMALDVSIAEAEAIVACVTEAVRLRRDGEAGIAIAHGKVVTMETRRLRAFFDDPDGPLERA